MSTLRLNISNERLCLRELTSEDWVRVHTYASQDRVSRYQPWGPNTENDSQNFVSQAIEDAKDEPRVRFTFAIINEEIMIGVGECTIKSFANRVGEIGYIVHPDYWGKGIATAVAHRLIAFGFEVLKLHRIYATCDPRNIGSSRVLEKVGMKKEGRMREDLLIKDGWRDSLLYSILEQE